MNNLSKIREKIKKANRLYQAQILATQNGEITPYRRSLFVDRTRQIQREIKLKEFQI